MYRPLPLLYSLSHTVDMLTLRVYYIGLPNFDTSLLVFAMMDGLKGNVMMENNQDF